MIFEYRSQAKSQCKPSSRLISSLLKQSPGIRPRFFNQKMAQKESEKIMPSTAANVIMHSAKLSYQVMGIWIYIVGFHRRIKVPSVRLILYSTT
jgi:hypothetical protein